VARRARDFFPASNPAQDGARQIHQMESIAVTHWRSRSSFPLPPGSILTRSKFSQAMLDVLAICVGVLLVSVTGIGVAGSLFVLLFVRF
jgi:hypothetical protein